MLLSWCCAAPKMKSNHKHFCPEADSNTGGETGVEEFSRINLQMKLTINHGLLKLFPKSSVWVFVFLLSLFYVVLVYSLNGLKFFPQKKLMVLDFSLMMYRRLVSIPLLSYNMVYINWPVVLFLFYYLWQDWTTRDWAAIHHSAHGYHRIFTQKKLSFFTLLVSLLIISQQGHMFIFTCHVMC